jgi:hypothetical protein
MRFKNVDERYNYTYRKEHALLEQYANDKRMFADGLIDIYKMDGREIPDDIYRACVFFINSEYNTKPGSLWSLYEASEKFHKENPHTPKERFMDKLCYEFQLMAQVLEDGGFNGRGGK